MNSITFFVKGHAVTKGSLVPRHRFDPSGNCRVFVTEEHGARLKEWRALVATAAKRAMGQRRPFYGPLRVVTTFYFARPKSHTAEQRAIPWVFVTKRNDLEKLERAVYDAISDSAIWMDDSQVVSHDSQKVYAQEGEQPGVLVSLEALS